MKRRCCKICKWLAIITCSTLFWYPLTVFEQNIANMLSWQNGHSIQSSHASNWSSPTPLGMMSKSHVPTEVCNRESDRRPAQFCKVAGFQESGFQGSMVPRFQGCILPGTTPRPNDWSTTGSLLGISRVYLGNRIYIKFPNVETVWTIKTQSNCNIIRA
jgi:hypothetical protein